MMTTTPAPDRKPCPVCGGPRDGGHASRCRACAAEEERRRLADPAYRAAANARKRAAWAAHRDEENAKQRARYAAKRAANNSARVAAGAPPTLPGDMAQARWRRLVKAAAIAAYGGPDPRCHCCGEGVRAFLGIAPAGRAGVGPDVRRRPDEEGRGPDRHCVHYARLADAGFPPGCVVRCINCKFAVLRHGACPHQDPGVGTAGAAPGVEAWRRRRRREAALAAYGGRCACCGEAHPAFLRLVPAAGGDAGPRPSWGRLVREGFPPGWVVRCDGCDTAVRSRGVCAHAQPAEGDPFAVVWPGDAAAAAPALGAPGGKTRRALARLAALVAEASTPARDEPTTEAA